MDNKQLIASLLIEIEAVKLSPEEPYTWASGWKSPIYCDNRRTLSVPHVRDTIKTELLQKIIHEKYPDTECIAGVATGAIAHGVLVADELGLPFIYVRSGEKKHGLGNMIEGKIVPKQKVVVIEDLVSTGGSSLGAVESLRQSGVNVLGMLAIFSYGFELATKNFVQAKVKLDTLSSYEKLVELAINSGYIDSKHINILSNWRSDPENWGS